MGRDVLESATGGSLRWLGPALLLCAFIAALWGSYGGATVADATSPAGELAMLSDGNEAPPLSPSPCDRGEDAADDVEALPLLRSRTDSGFRRTYWLRVDMSFPEHWPLRETPPPRA